MASNKHAPKVTRSGTSSGRRIFIAVIVFVLISLAGNFLADTLRPWTKALVPTCIDRTQPDAWFTNVCDFDINLSYCLENESDKNYADCPVTPLAPGQGTSPAAGEKLETDAYANRQIWACKAPFRPVMTPSLSNRNIMRTSCGRPEKETG